MNRGNLFIISGPSGTGKGTICEEFKRYDDVYLSVSVTTRNQRLNEVDGVTYIYTSVEDFKRRIDEGLMLEWAQYGDNFYGTPKDVVEEKLSQGINVILEIEVQGAFEVKRKMPEAIMIFVVPPSMEELRKRLVLRGRENDEEIDKRIDIAIGEMKLAPQYNYVIVNDELEKSVLQVREIIDERKTQVDFVAKLLNEVNN